MNRILNVVFLVLGLSIVEVAKSEDQSDIEARIVEMEAFEGSPAIWEGQFRVVSAPQKVLDSIQHSDSDNEEIRIRVHLTDEADPELFLWYPGEDDWTEISGTGAMHENLFGWTVFVLRYSGQWIEKYHITFAQLESEEAAITFTRTVQNWYIPEPTEDAYDFYHMFGFGRVEKHEPSEATDEHSSRLAN